MKLNKKQIELIASLPDDALARVIRSLGKSAGVDLSGVNLGAAELETLRCAVRGMSETDLMKAAELLKRSGG